MSQRDCSLNFRLPLLARYKATNRFNSPRHAHLKRFSGAIRWNFCRAKATSPAQARTIRESAWRENKYIAEFTRGCIESASTHEKYEVKEAENVLCTTRSDVLTHFFWFRRTRWGFVKGMHRSAELNRGIGFVVLEVLINYEGRLVANRLRLQWVLLDYDSLNSSCLWQISFWWELMIIVLGQGQWLIVPIFSWLKIVLIWRWCNFQLRLSIRWVDWLFWMIVKRRRNVEDALLHHRRFLSQILKMKIEMKRNWVKVKWSKAKCDSTLYGSRDDLIGMVGDRNDETKILLCNPCRRKKLAFWFLV